MNELDLPPGPSLPPEVRERALRTVLAGMDAPPTRRMARWTPFLAVAAVVLVAVAVTTVADAGPEPPAVTSGSIYEPLPADQLPPRTGNPEVDAVLDRCATAVVRSGHAAEYPPTSTWRPTIGLQQSPAAIPPPPWLITTATQDALLTINDSFGCMASLGSVILSRDDGTPVGGVRWVRMAPDVLFASNPQRLRFTVYEYPQPHRVDGAPAGFVHLLGWDLAEPRLSVDGGYDGPIPEPVAGLTIVDRVLPHRTDTPDGRELGSCIASSRLAFIGSRLAFLDPELWIPVGRHDTDGAAPRALVARVGDIAVGICVLDPVTGPHFTTALLPPPGDQLLPPPGDQVQVIIERDFGKTVGVGFRSVDAFLLAAGPEVTRIRITPTADPAAGQDCTIIDGLAACTLAGHFDVVLTAFTAADPEGTVIVRPR